jgi:undecaprenyl-diphosphatase
LLETLQNIDTSLFLFLNGFHNGFFDHVMILITRGLIWIPLYLVFLYLVIRQYKWKTLIILVFMALMILVSDQLTNLVKESVQRLRPSHEPGLMVHIVDAYKGGSYGFYSAHASNNFAIAFFLILLLGKYYRYFFIPVLLYALIMSYSRIYLGLHYPGDTLAGMITGILIGFMTGKLCTWSLKQDYVSFHRKKPD